MPRRTVARLFSALVVGLVAAALAACSDQSPVSPGPAPGAALQVGVLAQPVDGSGEISFVTDDFPPSVIVVAHVTAEGNPAQGGEVTFQFCVNGVDRGVPSGSLPSVECEPGGSGRWRRAATVPVVAGEASMDFCCVSTQSILGFRFVYYGKGSGIGNFTSLPKDFIGASP